MSPTDKRRSAHQAPPPSSSSASSTLRSANSSRTSAATIIAAPPRAQLGNGTSSSSPTGAPDIDNNTHEPSSSTHHHHHGPTATNSGTSSKDSRAANSSSGSSKSTKDHKDGQLLREKDEKIASLKRDLAEMATEFERTLDKLSHSESETASFWQAKHSALSQHFSRAETELKLLQAELDVRMAEREEMRDALDAMRRDLAAREEEVLSLKGHLAKMKQWISASGKMEDQTSDQEFADMMMKLMNGLQNWVISHFKKARLEISSTDDDVVGELARLVPMFVQVASQSKLALLQSIVSQIMVELVFQPYFPGLPDDQNRRLRQHEDDLAAMIPAEAINQWRASTLALIRKHSTEAIRQHSASLLDNSVARLNQILDSITDANTTDMRDQAARALLSNAMELAQSLALQKARFTVKIPSVLPQEHVTYDQSTMEDTGGEDDDDLIGRPVLCIIFPALVKNGDAAGEHLHFENVICKAKVLCTSE